MERRACMSSQPKFANTIIFTSAVLSMASPQLRDQSTLVASRSFETSKGLTTLKVSLKSILVCILHTCHCCLFALYVIVLSQVSLPLPAMRSPTFDAPYVNSVCHYELVLNEALTVNVMTEHTLLRERWLSDSLHLHPLFAFYQSADSLLRMLKYRACRFYIQLITPALRSYARRSL